jgi:hypothetical protein
MGCYLKKVGRENAIMMSLVFILLQEVGLSYSATLKDTDIFILISLISQFVGGIGSGIKSVALMA